MDERREWATPAGLVALAWVLAAGALAWFLVLFGGAADAPGQLLAAVAAVGLTVAATSATRARPRLAVGPDGLTVRRLGGTLRVGWAGVDRTRVLRTRRFGRETSLLELDLRTDDGTERLVVLGRLDLGEDPEDVLDVIRSCRPG